MDNKFKFFVITVIVLIIVMVLISVETSMKGNSKNESATVESNKSKIIESDLENNNENNLKIVSNEDEVKEEKDTKVEAEIKEDKIENRVEIEVKENKTENKVENEVKKDVVTNKVNNSTNNTATNSSKDNTIEKEIEEEKQKLYNEGIYEEDFTDLFPGTYQIHDEYENVYYNSIVEIEKIDSTKVKFKIETVHGRDVDHVNIGSVDGIANLVEPDEYEFVDTIDGKTNKIRLKFITHRKFVFLEVTENYESEINPYAGHNVWFEGEYEKIK